jgi:hypothetical protein
MAKIVLDDYFGEHKLPEDAADEARKPTPTRCGQCDQGSML